MGTSCNYRNMVCKLTSLITIALIGSAFAVPFDVDQVFEIEGANGVMCERCKLGAELLMEKLHDGSFRENLLSHADGICSIIPFYYARKSCRDKIDGLVEKWMDTAEGFIDSPETFCSK